jgi:Cu/Zn superoxide dismutase
MRQLACMKALTRLSILVALVACGGSKPKPAEPTPPPAAPPAAEAPAEAKAPAEPPAPPPPPPPKTFKATAALTPVKGQKLAATTVSFAQQEGKDTQVSSEGGVSGLAKGTYHLVVHTSADCGANAAKAGAAMKDAPNVDVTVGADKKGTVDASDVKLALDGDSSIVGHTLVLHADAKGKPGKAIACGPIQKAGGGEE